MRNKRLFCNSGVNENEAIDLVLRLGKRVEPRKKLPYQSLFIPCYHRHSTIFSINWSKDPNKIYNTIILGQVSISYERFRSRYI